MSEGFCLIEEPWIPCERGDGSRVELGLQGALVSAHELRAVADGSPLVTPALHRLLLAILHRCFGPESLQRWIEIYRAGRFEEAKLREYFDRWRERFDLFHPERPFYQVRGLPFAPDRADLLLAERSKWGGGLYLFEHRPEGMGTWLSPATAARWLLATHAVAPGGTGMRQPGEPTSASAAPLNRGAVCLVRGMSLFETLTLNLLVYGGDLPIPAKNDAPAWEAEPLPRELKAVKHEPGRVPRGWIDLLTWQSRRLELRVEQGRVTGVTRCMGQGFARERPRDPMQAYRLDEKRGPLPLGFDVDRAFWRDSHALFQASDSAQDVERPRTLEQLAHPELRKVIGPTRRFQVDLLGLRGKQAKILLVRSESVPVSPRLLADPDLGTSVREALTNAETAAQALRSALFVLAARTLAPGDRTPDEKHVRSLVQASGAEGRFWSAGKRHFDELLWGLADDERGASSRFTAAIRMEAERAYEAAMRRMGSGARALKGAVAGRSTLAGRLAILSPRRVREVAS